MTWESDPPRKWTVIEKMNPGVLTLFTGWEKGVYCFYEMRGFSRPPFMRDVKVGDWIETWPFMKLEPRFLRIVINGKLVEENE